MGDLENPGSVPSALVGVVFSFIFYCRAAICIEISNDQTFVAGPPICIAISNICCRAPWADQAREQCLEAGELRYDQIIWGICSKRFRLPGTKSKCFDLNFSGLNLNLKLNFSDLNLNLNFSGPALARSGLWRETRSWTRRWRRGIWKGFIYLDYSRTHTLVYLYKSTHWTFTLPSQPLSLHQQWGPLWGGRENSPGKGGWWRFTLDLYIYILLLWYIYYYEDVFTFSYTLLSTNTIEMNNFSGVWRLLRGSCPQVCRTGRLSIQGWFSTICCKNHTYISHIIYICHILVSFLSKIDFQSTSHKFIDWGTW